MDQYYLLSGEVSRIDETYSIKLLLKKIKVDIDFLNDIDNFLIKLKNNSSFEPKYWAKKSQDTLLASKRCYYNIRALIELYENFDTHSHICNHFAQLKKKLTTEIITAGFNNGEMDSALIETRDGIEVFLESNGAKKTELILEEYKRLDKTINNELLKKIKNCEILLSKLTDLHFYIMNITISKSL
ncbi:hypothetical protein MUB04_14240 [Acinetobacter indicus]|uniref:hypothetical protein n=1 Tax=Acinetobacter TaxID=469 RepID=UPI0015D235AE|nr:MULTISPECIES: hypothetical protein [Acinetobacter]MCP0917690.1 hypothetical protein [Acinetobacter indicus]